MSDENKNDSDGSVWTSYSDLFTNVAIIFLVMFVFALIKSTVSQIKNVQKAREHEIHLQGKLTKKEIERNKERVVRVERAVYEMEQYEKIIDEKMIELNAYAKKLQENKIMLNEMVEAQAKQDMLIKAAEENFKSEEKIRKEKEFSLKEAETKAAILVQELKKTKNLVLKNEEVYQKHISSQNTLAEKQQKELQKKVSDLNQKLEKAESKVSLLKQDLSKELSKGAGQESEIASSQQKLKHLEQEINTARQKMEALSSEKSGLSSNLKKMTDNHELLKNEFTDLQKKFSKVDSFSNNLNEKLSLLTGKSKELENEAQKWKSEFEKKLNEADGLKKELHSSKERFNNLAKTLTQLKDRLKNNVANALGEKFREQGLNAEINPTTGEVVLLSGEGINFEKGSHKLLPGAKVAIKKLIPVYAEVILGDKKISSQISVITIEGHSSPLFGGKYVSPEDKNHPAYSYNMRLSAMRASEMASYLMSDEIGEYPHKDRMKILLQSIGHGYMKPLARSNERDPASNSFEDCGPWSCSRSQRVQINFLLKDNIEEIHKIIDANGGIK